MELKRNHLIYIIMEKREDIQKRIKRLTAIGAVSAAVVIVCVFCTIKGMLVAPFPGVVFAVAGCMAMEEASRLERKSNGDMEV